jgi:hypothetical protein
MPSKDSTSTNSAGSPARSSTNSTSTRRNDPCPSPLPDAGRIGHAQPGRAGDLQHAKEEPLRAQRGKRADRQPAHRPPRRPSRGRARLRRHRPAAAALRPCGLSRLASRGNVYSFNHYRGASVNPISWKTVYDGIAGTTRESVPSAASQSLLRFLLVDQLGHSGADILLYSRPAADADITLTKEEVTGTGVGMEVDDLRIEVQYDYFEQRADLCELEVRVPEGLMPTIYLESPNGGPAKDVNGRGDGRGDVVRVFNRGRTRRARGARHPRHLGLRALGGRKRRRPQDPRRLVARLPQNGPEPARSSHLHQPRRYRAALRSGNCHQSREGTSPSASPPCSSREPPPWTRT